MELPIACSLDANQLRTRDDLLPGLLRVAKSVEDLETGYRLQFDASHDTLYSITHVIDAERQCCRFLRFELTVEAGGGPISLTVTGPAGTREFLADLLAKR